MLEDISGFTFEVAAERYVPFQCPNRVHSLLKTNSHVQVAVYHNHEPYMHNEHLELFLRFGLLEERVMIGEFHASIDMKETCHRVSIFVYYI